MNPNYHSQEGIASGIVVHTNSNKTIILYICSSIKKKKKMGGG